MLEASTVQKIWSLIEETSTHILLNQSDLELTQDLIKRLKNEQILNLEEYECAADYIHSKMILIRDLADSRELVVLSSFN